MADPQKLDVSEWGVILTLVGGFITAVITWVRRLTKPYNDRIAALEGTVYGKAGQEGHDTQLAVIRTNQDHLTHRLEEIRQCTQETNEKMDGLNERITDVIMELRRK